MPCAMLQIYIQAYPWTVVFFQILDELLWSTRKFQFLRNPLKFTNFLDQLFFRWLLSKLNKYSC